eukprot:GHVT01023820.1.p1 GENE.GHVT01023820.1~~GHVT01023820.1.p1  ORF type:complete len:171 (-),score=30.62 GHVT01023820.1:1143-1655(-)
MRHESSLGFPDGLLTVVRESLCDLCKVLEFEGLLETDGEAEEAHGGAGQDGKNETGSGNEGSKSSLGDDNKSSPSKLHSQIDSQRESLKNRFQPLRWLARFLHSRAEAQETRKPESQNDISSPKCHPESEQPNSGPRSSQTEDENHSAANQNDERKDATTLDDEISNRAE